MKNQNWIWIVIFLLEANTLLSAQNWGGNGIIGTGPKVKKTLTIDAFNGFTLGIGGNVYLTQGNTQSVTVEAQQNIIDNILTTVSDNHWNIRFDKNVRNYEGIKIWITVPILTKAYVSGSGNIIGETKFTKLNDLVVGVSGSGNIKLELEAQDIDGKISGSGDVKLGGVAKSLNISISGSGDFISDALRVQSATIHISGSGDATVHAEDSLEVRVSGSGDVRYRGRPKVVAKVSGSGDVKSM